MTDHPQAVYEPAGPIPGTISESGEILTDIQCKRCSYDLRGLNVSWRCPECGTPVGLSVSGDLLRFADPQWVTTVGRGLTIILWMILATIVVGALGVFLTAVIGPAIPALLGLGVALVSFYGVWLMTEPDPSGIGEDPNLTARKIVRITLVVGIAGTALRAITEAVSLPAAITQAISIVVIATVLVGLVGEFAKFVFYERLAQRIPDTLIAKRARFLRWAYVVTYAIILLGAVLVAIAVATSPGGTPMIGGLGCAMVPVGLAFLVFAVMTLFMLLRLRRLVIQQARIAEQTWASAASSTGPVVH